MTGANDRSGRKATVCPICGKPSVKQYRLFCSARCSDVDLNRWLSGRYVVPVDPDEEDGEPKRDLEN